MCKSFGALAALTLVSSTAYAQATAPSSAPAPSTPPAIVVPEGCTARGTGANVTIVCGTTPTTPPSAAQAPTVQPQRPPPPQPTTHEESKWYGWQTLIVDGAVITGSIVMGSASSNAGGAMTVFSAGYLLGGPIVHWANGQVGKGFASLGIRLALPLVGGIAGGLIGGATGDYDGFDSFSGSIAGMSLGVFIGGAGAIAIDAAALARKTVTVQNAPVGKLKLQWRPTAGYDAKRQTMQVGVTGTF